MVYNNREFSQVDFSYSSGGTFPGLAEKYGLSFYFSTCDSGQYWLAGNYQKKVDINLAVIDEVRVRYGQRKAFNEWYLRQEASRRTRSIIHIYSKIGCHCRTGEDGKSNYL
ncbi:MAG: DUF4434 domain-containing protein [Spirochaetales bacterium]|nr:DUF4434 domain-containing protein [Spirochaetales bacterium]